MQTIARGAIRDPGSYKQLFDHSGLAGAFARAKITPTDIEFMVEQDGRFIYGEFKYANKDLDYGQRRAFENLVRANRGLAFFFVAEHHAQRHEVIDTASCRVREVYWMEGIPRHHFLKTPLSVLDLCRLWTQGHGTWFTVDSVSIFQQWEAA